MLQDGRRARYKKTERGADVWRAFPGGWRRAPRSQRTQLSPTWSCAWRRGNRDLACCWLTVQKEMPVVVSSRTNCRTRHLASLDRGKGFQPPGLLSQTQEEERSGGLVEGTCERSVRGQCRSGPPSSWRVWKRWDLDDASAP